MLRSSHGARARARKCSQCVARASPKCSGTCATAGLRALRSAPTRGTVPISGTCLLVHRRGPVGRLVIIVEAAYEAASSVYKTELRRGRLRGGLVSIQDRIKKRPPTRPPRRETRNEACASSSTEEAAAGGGFARDCGRALCEPHHRHPHHRGGGRAASRETPVATDCDRRAASREAVAVSACANRSSPQGSATCGR